MPTKENTTGICPTCLRYFTPDHDRKIFCSRKCYKEAPLPSPLVRFMNHVEVQPNGCWWWRGYINPNGYGKFSAGRGLPTPRMAHVVSYELHKAPVPPGLQVDHTCHKKLECAGGPTCPHRRCVNPDHLEAVTRLENTRRGNAGVSTGAKQKSRTHCKNGHPFINKHKVLSHGKLIRVCLECGKLRMRDIRARRRSAAQRQPVHLPAIGDQDRQDHENQ